MDYRVFAVDFFDNTLWDNIAVRAGGSGIYEKFFCCECCRPCEKVRFYLFSQRQLRVLLDTITPVEETNLLHDLQERDLMNLSRWRVASSRKKILCLSGSEDKPEVIIVGHTAGKRNYIFDRNNFNAGNPLPWQSLEELIIKGLRKQIIKEVGTGYISLFWRMMNKPGNSLIDNAAGVNDKNHWLYYLSFTENTEENKKKKYNAKQIVHCLDISGRSCWITEGL